MYIFLLYTNRIYFFTIIVHPSFTYYNLSTFDVAKHVLMVNKVLKRIRIVRTEKNLTQEYLAAKLKITQSYYGRIENGKTELTLKRMFEVLEIHSADFFEAISTD